MIGRLAALFPSLTVALSFFSACTHALYSEASDRASFPVQLTDFSLITADFDGDGVPDLAARAGLFLTVFRNDGTGSFERMNTWQGEAMSRYVPCRLDEDAFPDLVAADFRALFMAYGVGQGQFESVEAVRTLDEVRDFRATDLDGDGLDDLVFGGGERG